ncbi:MAG: DUF433 domain-containing protein [Bryobacteraceae bacterium]|nr:DUF433 domain-containing protein [Bryobacteraceae bacterium]
MLIPLRRQGKIHNATHLPRCHGHHVGPTPRPPRFLKRQITTHALAITAWDILGWLAAGATETEILDDYPELEPSEFKAVQDFAPAHPQP